MYQPRISKTQPNYFRILRSSSSIPFEVDKEVAAEQSHDKASAREAPNTMKVGHGGAKNAISIVQLCHESFLCALAPGNFPIQCMSNIICNRCRFAAQAEGCEPHVSLAKPRILCRKLKLAPSLKLTAGLS